MKIEGLIWESLCKLLHSAEHETLGEIRSWSWHDQQFYTQRLKCKLPADFEHKSNQHEDLREIRIDVELFQRAKKISRRTHMPSFQRCKSGQFQTASHNALGLTPRKRHWTRYRKNLMDKSTCIIPPDKAYCYKACLLNLFASHRSPNQNIWTKNCYLARWELCIHIRNTWIATLIDVPAKPCKDPCLVGLTCYEGKLACRQMQV